MSKFLKAFLVASMLASPALAAGKYGLGRVATADEVKAWDIDVRPDGVGLPKGKGTVEEGEELFVDNCASCHGDFGEGVDRWPVLSGGHGSLTDERPVKTIGSYWPYASTLFDYIRRAMPFGAAQTLEADEIYAITAYLLNMNDVVDDDFELSDENFKTIKLENEANFFMDDRAEKELKEFVEEPCMSACKAKVEITKRAVIVDVTPEEGGEVGGSLD
ncbi:MAG: cytochrome c [Cohaesibacter sp.]|nr:cytochrome c [Cohaesibacter sp.]